VSAQKGQQSRIVKKLRKRSEKMANGKSDIQLWDDIDGQVKVAAPDLCVDGEEGRRKGRGKSNYRRALVHDLDDGLTMNWDDDYSGGVTIRGVKKIMLFDTGTPYGQGILAFGRACNVEGDVLIFDGLHVLQFNVRVNINGDVTFAQTPTGTGTVTMDGKVQVRKKPPPHGRVLQNPDYWDLEHEISTLNGRVTALEKNVFG
jgi:hypothetical protein